MIRRALILLPARTPPGGSVPTILEPLTPLGGLSLLQRTIYTLQWAGIERGLIVADETSPEVEEHVRLDPRNKAFRTFLRRPLEAVPAGVPGGGVFSGDLLLCTPYWIVDREVLRRLCRDEAPLTKPILFTAPAAADPPGAGSTIPPLVLLPGGKAEPLLAVLREAPSRKSPEEALEACPHLERRALPASDLIRVERASDLREAERRLFRKLIKPTESFLSRNFERKISLAITRRLLPHRVTPNQVSLFSILLGLLSALFFLAEGRPLHVTGTLLLAFSNIIDGCDGELARLRFQESRPGSLLDFLGDNLVHMAVFFSIGLGLYLRGEGLLYLVLGGLAALGTMGSAGAVFWRVFHHAGDRVITFTTPVRGEEMERARGGLRKRIEFTEKISNRDFIYLILLASAVGQLRLIAWMSALGSLFFCLNLLLLYRRMRGLGTTR